MVTDDSVNGADAHVCAGRDCCRDIGAANDLCGITHDWGVVFGVAAYVDHALVHNPQAARQILLARM